MKAMCDAAASGGLLDRAAQFFKVPMPRADCGPAWVGFDVGNREWPLGLWVGLHHGLREVRLLSACGTDLTLCEHYSRRLGCVSLYSARQRHQDGRTGVVVRALEMPELMRAVMETFPREGVPLPEFLLPVFAGVLAGRTDVAWNYARVDSGAPGRVA